MGSCYNDNIKRMCVKVVGAISILLCIVGLITVILGSVAMGLVQKPNNFIPAFQFDQSGLGLGIMALGALTIVTAIIGCGVIKFKTPWCGIPFVILTFLFALILIIVAFIALAVSGPIVKTLKAQVCASGQAGKLQTNYNSAISKYVCSQTCPCPEGDGQEYKTLWESYGNGFFTAFNRQKNFNTMSKSEQDSFKNNGDRADVTPMVFVGSDKTSYSSWEECYDGVLKPEIEKNKNSQQWRQITDFLSSGGLDFLKEVEKNLNCASVCKVPMTYVTLHIKEGRPE